MQGGKEILRGKVFAQPPQLRANVRVFAEAGNSNLTGSFYAGALPPAPPLAF